MTEMNDYLEKLRAERRLFNQTIMNELDLKVPEDIDSYSLRDAYEPDRIALRLGLVCSLYVPEDHSADLRRRLAQCGDEYLSSFGSHIRLCLNPSGIGRFKKYPQKGISLIGHIEEKDHPEMSFSPYFTGGDTYEEASAYTLNFASHSTKFGIPESRAYFAATLPLSALGAENPFQSFGELLHGWCKRVRPQAGTAGIGIIQSVEMMEKKKTSHLAYPLALRYPGLEMDNPGVTSGLIGDGVKGVNWLTALGDANMDRLGGRQAVLSKLSEDFHVFEYDGGVLIQAGERPELGDGRNRVTPESYRRLAKIVSPLRISFPANHSLFQPQTGEDNTLVTNDWLARFED